MLPAFRYIPLTIALILSLHLFAQKPLIDTSAFKKWPDLNFLNVSSDARFATFFIHDNEYNVDTFCIKSVKGKWE